MLKVDRVEFLLSAVKPDQFLPPDRPEIAFSGRSNVGKSSLLNLLVRRKSIAKVSRTPGKTRAVNFFDVEGQWRLVDLPGYGYARLSQNEIADWGHVIDTYLRDRPNLWVVVQLIDSRHKPTQLDMEMMDWLAQSGMPTIIALTKVDKLNQNDRRDLVNRFRKEWLGSLNWPVVATSADHKEGREELLAILEEFLEAAWQSGKFDNASTEAEAVPSSPPPEVEPSPGAASIEGESTPSTDPHPRHRGSGRASARQKPSARETSRSASSTQNPARPRHDANRGNKNRKGAQAAPPAPPFEVEAPPEAPSFRPEKKSSTETYPRNRGKGRDSGRQRPFARETSRSASSTQKPARPRHAANRENKSRKEAQEAPDPRSHTGKRIDRKGTAGPTGPKKKGSRPPRRRRTN